MLGLCFLFTLSAQRPRIHIVSRLFLLSLSHSLRCFFVVIISTSRRHCPYRRRILRVHGLYTHIEFFFLVPLLFTQSVLQCDVAEGRSIGLPYLLLYYAHKAAKASSSDLIFFSVSYIFFFLFILSAITVVVVVVVAKAKDN